ncbi:hypothetical protein BU23DRAFT_15187 [Bimuria novae-zelandiae CBS 107.79]|uniref:BTB domain-containing protein n=1 Tax=Bimuria novae-zelandiae CBS 107.79 TaxID=1447943 RepID=A0A6A5VPT9_9PLEO|nr:hypothetical protein BU23DRAFT_15187 [Bimuria novae-zelandiae CBS 107.79]
MSTPVQGGHEEEAAGRPLSTPEIGRPDSERLSQAWTLVPDDQAQDRAPRVTSLFSAGRGAALPEGSSEQHTQDAAAPHVGGPSPSNSSRPLATLASFANMKRSQRMRAQEEPSPIAQFSTQIPSAQKTTDDPTTPPDSKPARETRGREYTTLTTLSRLFAGNDTVPDSRTPSYNQATGPLHMRASSESIPLPDHLYTRGLLEGRHSDITVIAFGQRYNLHRLILDRAPFFTTALSEPWIESQSREVKLYPEDIDSNITQAAFELAIKRLYGVDISPESDVEAIGLFAAGCWLEMQDLIDGSIESILRQMTPELLGPLIRLVTSNYYGRSGDRILESAKAMLSRNGWEMPLKFWDGMPGDIIRELVASDGFYVDSEWDRWVLAKCLLDRRLRQAAVGAGLIQRGQRPTPKAPNSSALTAVRFGGAYRQDSLTLQQSGTDTQSDWLALYSDPDIERILVLLDEGIHYIHMEYEQLEFIREARDVFGLPVMPDRVISNALWQQLALRQKVVNADESSQELGLCKQPPEPVTANTGTKTEGFGSIKGKQKAIAQRSNEDKETEWDSGSWGGSGKPRKFWIPSSDCNIVLGNGTDPVVTTSSSFQRHATRLSATLQPEDAQWATDFASSPGTMANPNTRTDHGRPISAGGSNAGQPRPIAYTEFPPFRFAAEFPNPRFLKEKKRVYSRTVSYAGSLWNIYIQKVRSAKNVQLGVYLHRAKEREGDDNLHANGVSQQNAGSVDQRIGQLEREMMLRSERRERRRSGRGPPTDHANDEDTSGSGGDVDGTLVSKGSRNAFFTPGSLVGRRSGTIPRLSSARGHSQFQFPAVGSPPTDGEGPAESPFFPLTDAPSDIPSDDSDDEDDESPISYPDPLLLAQRRTRATTPTLPTYVDARPTIKTYFKIYSPSKGGRMLSVYESAPDRFNFSQSWGWKSSTLMLDEVALTGGAVEPTPPDDGIPNKKGEGKLRFMVVIGNL